MVSALVPDAEKGHRMNRFAAFFMCLAASAGCAQGYAPWDANNYVSPDGTCAYTDCRSDAECRASITAYPSACR